MYNIPPHPPAPSPPNQTQSPSPRELGIPSQPTHRTPTPHHTSRTHTSVPPHARSAWRTSRYGGRHTCTQSRAHLPLCMSTTVVCPPIELGDTTRSGTCLLKILVDGGPLEKSPPAVASRIGCLLFSMPRLQLAAARFTPELQDHTMVMSVLVYQTVSCHMSVTRAQDYKNHMVLSPA